MEKLKEQLKETRLDFAKTIDELDVKKRSIVGREDPSGGTSKAVGSSDKGEVGAHQD